jgi:hypothetical protein
MADVAAVVAAGCVIYGLALLLPALAWIATGVVLGVVAVELGKRELAARVGHEEASR